MLQTVTRFPFILFAVGILRLSAAEPDETTYYRAPQSYSTTRDPDIPKYARKASETGVPFLSNAPWLDIGLDHRTRFEYRDGDIRRPIDVVDEPFLFRTRA